MHKYKVGDVLYIKGNTNNHGFHYGQQVEIISCVLHPLEYGAKSINDNVVMYAIKEQDLSPTPVNAPVTEKYDPFYQGDMD